MKAKITDLMDLYEDDNCPLSPAAKPDGRAVDDRPYGEDGGKLLEIKTARHSFGWREIASLAAVLVLLVLGGFTAKWFLGRVNVQPEQTGASGQTKPTGFDSVDLEEWFQFNSQLTNVARMGFPKLNGNGEFASAEDLYPYRFAQAAALTDAAGETYTVAFEAYEADPTLWPEFLSLDPSRIGNVSELLRAGKLRVIGTGSAEFRRESGGLRLTGYTFTPESGVTTPESLHLRGESDPEIARLSRFLTAFAQQGIGDANAELDGDAELVRFVFRYRQANDPKSILKQEDGDVPARTLTLEQVNETLNALLGKTLSPNGEDYSILSDAAEPFNCFYRDGRFRYIPPYDYDGEDALRFAKAERYGEATGVLHFTVYRVNLANWPDAETYLGLLPVMTVEDLEGSTGIVTKIAEGDAVLRDLGGDLRLVEYTAEPVR